MNELLSSLKADLLDRRMLPILVLLGAVLAAAIAYAVLGGGSSTPSGPVAAASANSAPKGSSLAVSQASANPNAAIAETTDGARYQHHSGSHNPFAALPSAKKAAASSNSGSSSSASSSSSKSASSPSSTSGSTGSATGSGGGTTPTPTAPSEPTSPKQKKTAPVYLVDVLYGLAPTTPDQLSQLTPYADLRRLEPLPYASDPRIVFDGVSTSGDGAIFTNAGEAIIKGQGACMPSATQCEAINLAVGKTEEFEYLEPNGETVIYELKVVSITKKQASAARAARLNRRDHAGEALLRRLSPSLLRHLRFSSARGVLVYATHHRR